MKMTIQTTYTGTNYTDLELPEGKNDFKGGTSLNGVVEAEGGCEYLSNTYSLC